MDEQLFKAIAIFGIWVGMTILILLIAAGRILTPHFTAIPRRHLISGLALGGLSPIFIWLINDTFEEITRPIYLEHLSRLSNLDKNKILGASMLEFQRHFTNQSIESWLSLRDYANNLILILSAGVGGNLIACAVADWHRVSDAQPAALGDSPKAARP